jgi:hypothetical protein
MTVPPATTLLRLLAFTVPCVLGLAGIQPLIGAAAGEVSTGWAVGLAAPALAGAIILFAAARMLDRGDSVQPPWYSAWVLLPGAFILTGAAAMCLIGALVQFAGVTPAMWFLLVVGTVLWSGGMVVVRQASR